MILLTAQSLNVMENSIDHKKTKSKISIRIVIGMVIASILTVTTLSTQIQFFKNQTEL